MKANGGYSRDEEIKKHTDEIFVMKNVDELMCKENLSGDCFNQLIEKLEQFKLKNEENEENEEIEEIVIDFDKKKKNIN